MLILYGLQIGKWPFFFFIFTSDVAFSRQQGFTSYHPTRVPALTYAFIWSRNLCVLLNLKNRTQQTSKLRQKADLMGLNNDNRACD